MIQMQTLMKVAAVSYTHLDVYKRQHSFHLKRKECPRMKRNALNLLCMGLAFLIGVLLTPVDAYERDEMLSDLSLIHI